MSDMCSTFRNAELAGLLVNRDRRSAIARSCVDDEDALTSNVIRLASAYGCYGYRRITALLRDEGWSVNHKRVARTHRRQDALHRARQPLGEWLQ